MKILVTDADGTITFGKHIIPKEELEALKQFKEEDSENILVLATGRNLSPARYLLDTNDFYLFDYLILSNGAMILDKNEQALYLNPITFPVKEIVEILDGHYRLDSKDEHYFTQSYRYSTNFPVEVLNIIEDGQILDEDLYVISTRANDLDNQKELIEKISSLNIDCQIIKNRLDIDIMVMDFGIDKGDAVNKLIEHLLIEEYELYTIGDSFNDISMLNISNNSATFTNVPNEVKESAKHIVSNIAEYINEYVLK